MVCPTLGEEPEADEHHKRGKDRRHDETNLQHQPDLGNNSLNGTAPFRVGVFGGSISLEGWVRILQSHLTALELPVIVESNAIGATGIRFWLL